MIPVKWDLHFIDIKYQLIKEKRLHVSSTQPTSVYVVCTSVYDDLHKKIGIKWQYTVNTEI